MKRINGLLQFVMAVFFLFCFVPSLLNAATIDVMVVYDSTAKTWVDSNGGMSTFATDAIARMNQAAANSNIDLTFRLVYTAQVSYTYSGDLGVDLENLQAGAGNMAIVRQWRDTYGADLVVLLEDTGSAYGWVGVGYLLTSYYGQPDYAFTASAIQSVDISHTLTHEVGHNLGAHHSKYQTSDPGPNASLNTYSAGWYFTGTNATKYHTIMAYNSDGYGNMYMEAPLFSTPLLSYQGTVAGSATDGDNARTIRQTMDAVAGYRPTAIGYILTVFRAGNGSGTVTTFPSSIDCGSTCTALFDLNKQVILTATADVGSTFNFWTGCDTTSGNTCTVGMNTYKSVTATFTLNAYTLTATMTGTGTGTLSASGLSCTGSSCTGIYNYNTTVNIKATPAAGSAFDIWTGCDSVNGNICTITMTSARSVSANIVFTNTNIWTQKADFQPGDTWKRVYAVGFSIRGKGYLGQGYDGNRTWFGDFYEFDPSANTWLLKNPVQGGTALVSAVGFSIGTKGYIGTGSVYDGSTSFRKNLLEYDPVLITYTQKVDFGGTARAHAVGFSIGAKGYVGTGYDGSEKKDFWEYDPLTNTWTQKADFGGTARYGATGFSIGSKGYIGTGTRYNGNGTWLSIKDFWEYDPATNTWIQKADFEGTARTHAVGFSIGSKGYIGTGWDGSSTYYKDFWEYDPATNTWTQKADFGGTARYGATGFSIGSKGYIGTGWDGSSGTDDFWEYDPGASPLYASFPGAGVYQYNGTTWSQVTPNSPENMVVSGSTFYGDFGSSGIWMYNGSSWSQTAPSNPQMMTVSGSTLYGAFSGAGIWMYNGTTWSQTTPSNPEAILASGSNLYGDFGSSGIWMYNGTTWSQPTPSDPQMMTISGSTLYGAFSGAGIWMYNGTTWSQTTPSNPEAILASGSNLYGDFGSSGIWMYNGATWSQLSPLNPEQMVCTATDLYVDFGSAGIWMYNGSTWSQVTPNDPAGMVTGY